MAHIPNPALLREIATIGLDSLSEGVTDPLGHALADAAGGISETERVKHFLSGLLGNLTPAQLGHLQTAVRWGGRVTSSALKVVARRIMKNHHVQTNLSDVVIDAIDDLCENLSRRTENALTPEQVRAYTKEAVDRAVANPSSPTTAAAAASGAHMDQTFRLPSEELSPEIATYIATLTPIGLKRWGRLWLIRHESFYTDPENELHGSATIAEAIRALLVARPLAVRVLDRTDVVEDENDVRRDEAIRAFIGMAEVHLVSPSFAARAHDEVDRLVGGEARRSIVAFGHRWAGRGGRLLGAIAIIFLLCLAVAAFCFVMSTWSFVTGVSGEVVNGQFRLIMEEINKGIGWGLGSVTALMLASLIWSGFEFGVGIVGEPLHIVKQIIQAALRQFGINIEPGVAN